MDVTIINSILVLCLEGLVICGRNYEKPKQKYYELGKSCYIEGIFYTTCPKREYK